MPNAVPTLDQPASSPGRPPSPPTDGSPSGAPPTAPPSGSGRRDLAARLLVVAAVVIAALSLLPIANWIEGGFSDAQSSLRYDEWLSGSALALGVGVALAILARHREALWRDLPLDRIHTRVGERWWLLTGTLGAAALALYTLIADRVFGRLPQLIDEFAQTVQAHIFASGHLTGAVPQPLEFFATQHMLYLDGRMFSQFPPGGPAAIALGTLAGAEWLVGPVFGAIAVLAFAAYLRASNERPGTALLALALCAAAPFTAFMAGTRMNHVPTSAALLAASAALVAVARSTRPRPALALLCGLGYGIAATIRPTDAAAFALPGAAWLLTLAWRDRRRVADLLASGVGVAVPIALLFAFNAKSTGHPTLFGYQLLWGKAHDLGFHMAPWGSPHTPARGLELVSLYFAQLQRFLFESPLPSLAAMLGAFLLVRRTSGADRYLLASGLLVVLTYFAYWHNGYYLGPRFLHPLIPIAALWTARFPSLLRDRLGREHMGYRTAMYALITSAVVAVAFSIPLRWRQYTETYTVGRWNVNEASARAGAHDALVLVREGWESQLVIRLWGRGIDHSHSELYYHAVDACRLEQAITDLERRSLTGPAARQALDGLLRDSLAVRTVRLESGFNVRVQQGYPYTPQCMSRIRETEAGVLPLAPILATATDGNVYARDLHARDTLLLQQHPDRPVWLLVPENASQQARPKFVRADMDSLRAAWKNEAR